MQTVGDDLTVTNIKRIKKAADEGACNALLLKVRCDARVHQFDLARMPFS